MALKRIQKELKEIQEHPSNQWTAKLVKSDNLYNWICTILGPEGSPYAGGRFELKLDLPTDYPFSAPAVKFITPVYHPNISKEGTICLDILNSEWSSALKISMLLVSITSLLDDPNPDSALSGDIARLYKSDRKKYNQNAKEWTAKHAKK
jgi:ubiquitin-conjugating enzyme E2 D